MVSTGFVRNRSYLGNDLMSLNATTCCRDDSKAAGFGYFDSFWLANQLVLGFKLPFSVKYGCQGSVCSWVPSNGSLNSEWDLLPILKQSQILSTKID